MIVKGWLVSRRCVVNENSKISKSHNSLLPERGICLFVNALELFTMSKENSTMQRGKTPNHVGFSDPKIHVGTNKHNYS